MFGSTIERLKEFLESFQASDQAVDSTTEACPLERTQVQLRVVLYDPLADSELFPPWGLYGIWERERAGMGPDDHGPVAAAMPPAETPATNVRCTVHGTNHDIGEAEIEVSDLEEDQFVDVVFPRFNVRWDEDFRRFRNQDPRPYVSVHVEEGCGGAARTPEGVDVEYDSGRTVTAGDLTQPHLQPHGSPYRYQLQASATYKIRIWLKPKAIVMHWSVGVRSFNAGPPNFPANVATANANAATRPSRLATVCYNFRVEQDGTQDPTWHYGASPTDPRFWRHNLRIDGVPEVPGVNVPGRGQQNVDVRTMRNYYVIGRRQTTGNPEWGRPDGYAAHAGGYNPNTVGVNICGMAMTDVQQHDGALVRRGIYGGLRNDRQVEILPNNAFTTAQVDHMVNQVARLCRAWHIDSTDPKQLCTHREVDYLHRGRGSKWDITWLPESFQQTYRGERQSQGHTGDDAELCAFPADPDNTDPRQNMFRPAGHDPVPQEFRFHINHDDHPYVRVPLGQAYAHGRNQTDPVSDLLRRLIDDLM